MGRKKRYIMIICICIALIAVTAAAVWFIVVPKLKDDSPTGSYELITNKTPVTNILEDNTSYNSPLEIQSEITTLPPNADYVENYLAEANTYSSTIETTTTAPGSKVYFNVVTSGTVSDDNSLEGLTGAAKDIGELVLKAGFRYDKNQRIFYSESQSWQRNFGFTSLYDAGAALAGMYYDTMRLRFNCDNKDWMFQLWKGRYGITTGAEMGIYYKDPAADSDFYTCATDEDIVTMSFALYKGNDLYMTRGPERHWWLTGFRMFDMIAPGDLTLHATYFLDSSKMADALEGAIKDLGFIEGINYQRLGLTMTIIWN